MVCYNIYQNPLSGSCYQHPGGPRVQILRGIPFNFNLEKKVFCKKLNYS
jgi:hypothetical protein